VAGEKGAARLLGVPASTLESRIRKLGIDKATFRYDN
jgi:transcriptional regulator with GAF, ATPase, and Fis domain